MHTLGLHLYNYFKYIVCTQVPIYSQTYAHTRTTPTTTLNIYIVCTQVPIYSQTYAHTRTTPTATLNI